MKSRAERSKHGRGWTQIDSDVYLRLSAVLVVPFGTWTMRDYDDDWHEPARSRYREDEYDFSRPLPHSGLGIASFLVGVGALFFGILLVVVAGIMEAARPGGIDENSPEAMVVGLLLLADVVGALVGLVLGIIGAVTAHRNKLFAGLGIGINALVLLGLIAVLIVGLLAD